MDEADFARVVSEGLGLRQQRRTLPLQTTQIDGLIIPSLAEMLRVKAFLLTQRRATRDFIDVTALAEALGDSRSTQALSYLNLAYPAVGVQTAISQFAEACEAEPCDWFTVDLKAYKGLQPPFSEGSFVLEACRRLGRSLIKLELTGQLPQTLDIGFEERGA